MRLDAFGYGEAVERERQASGLRGLGIGRVVVEHRERYVVATESGDVEAEVSGSLRFAARGRGDFPAVGDWVALEAGGGGASIVHGILPRSSTISRRAVDGSGDVQVVAANVDHALLVQACDRDFNLNRLDRYMAVCGSSGTAPIVVLTKTDLIGEEDLRAKVEEVRRRVGDVPVAAVSDREPGGYGPIEGLMRAGRTYCLLGSSGVGKSTLLNRLSGRDPMRTGAISGSTGKGRHVTSHRELVVLEGGAILIDNPGMREVGIADEGGGLEAAFDRLLGLGGKCRFRDCTHTSESGCAVLEAVRRGEIDPEAYESWRKMERERAHFESSVAERRRKDRAFGKVVDSFKKAKGRI